MINTETMVSLVSPRTWTTNGGNAEINFGTIPGVYIIVETTATQIPPLQERNDHHVRCEFGIGSAACFALLRQFRYIQRHE